MGDTDRNASAPPDPGPVFSTRAGARLGPWQLRELLGSGGTGEVWAPCAPTACTRVGRP